MTRRSRQAAAFRPSVEFLECRCVPATITPTSFADGGLGSGSLRDAVLQFNADTGTENDTIQLLAGTYSLTIQNIGGHHETAGLTGDLNLTQTSHRWIIQGAGSATVIDASRLQDRVFQIVNPGTQVIFQDLVIQGGLAQDDGSDGALAGSTDALGGGIFNNGGEVTLENVVLQNNGAHPGDQTVRRATGYSARGAGIYSTDGALTLAGVTVSNNQATGGRGGHSSGTFYLAGTGGSANGAGLYASGGSLDISDSRIANNQATGGRGGDGAVYYTTDYTYSGGVTYVSHGLGGRGGAAQGGGLYVNGGSLTVASSIIASNQGTGGPDGVNGHGDPDVSDGGGLYVVSNAGTPTVSNSTLSGNFATYGGGISNVGTLTVSNTTLSGNSANFSGGGGISNYGTLTVSNSTLSGNTANYEGGGIYNSGTLTVSNSTLSGNFAGYDGGGIENYYSTLTVSNSTLSGNSATGYGGGISNVGTLAVSNSTLSVNSANPGGGGGISNYGALTVSNSTLSGNTGGGISNYGGLTVSNSTLSGNSAIFGGGIYNSGTLTVSNSTLSGNFAGYDGGGIYNYYVGTLTVSNSTLSGNSAYDAGGGICNYIYDDDYPYGTLTVSNSTLSGNFATYGGGIFTLGALSPYPDTLTNVTLTANRANAGPLGGGGGLYLFSSFTQEVLHNTLIAGNFQGLTGTTPDDVYGRLDPRGDSNLIGDGTGMTGLHNGVNGNQVGSASDPIDPVLGPLADNGGPTLTHALLPGSPAIDAGNNAYATDWDQRGPGYPRIVNGTIDIGAFEYQGDGSSRAVPLLGWDISQVTNIRADPEGAPPGSVRQLAGLVAGINLRAGGSEFVLVGTTGPVHSSSIDTFGLSGPRFGDRDPVQVTGTDGLPASVMASSSRPGGVDERVFAEFDWLSDDLLTHLAQVG
jgi:hypothetical protein